MSSSYDWNRFDVWLAIGFCAGLYYFYRGFRVFRQYRVLRDTPESPIRGIAMGLVEIHGKATGATPVPSPITKSPCFFYIVDIEHWVETRNGGRWDLIATDADGPKFYLEDDTGKVLVDAHHAQYNLLRTVTRETGYKPGMRWKNFFTGTLKSTGVASPPDSQTNLWTYAASVISRKKGHGFTAERTSGFESYRLTEYLIVPDHWYDITGTCAENPESKDVQDSKIIMKGTNEPTFLITFKNEKEIKEELHDIAKKYIFGGGIAAAVFLGLFLIIRGAF